MHVIFILLLMAVTTAQAQMRLGFYNCQNLYDTINQPATDDGDFTPQGLYRWDTQQYNSKVEALVRAINLFEPDILGLCEVENRDVVEDVAARLNAQYKVVHYDCADPRGIDVALIYKQGLTVVGSEPIKALGERPTRDLLRVEFELDGEQPLVVYVAHLPSRRGLSSQATLQRRAINGQIVQLVAAEKGKKVVVMGDMNGNPQPTQGLWNACQEPCKKGQGSYAYRDVWQMFDQILLTPNLGTPNATIFAHPSLTQQIGKYHGYPAKNNPSDHYPIFVDIK